MKPKPENYFISCQVAGFSLMFALWLFEGELTGFLLVAMLVMMSLIRNNFPKLKFTIFFDIIICVILSGAWGYAAYSLALPLFSAMYFGVYSAIITLGYLYINFNALHAAMLILSALCGLFLRFWADEYSHKLQLRDESAVKYYEMENLHNELVKNLMQVEKTAGISERTRIARDIHDNAGHEIAAAYISFQAIRKMLNSNRILGVLYYE